MHSRSRRFPYPVAARVRVVTPPVSPDGEQLSLERAYRQLNLVPFGSPLGHPDDDWLIEHIPLAREMIEDETGRTIAPQTLEAVFDRFPTSSWVAGVSVPSDFAALGPYFTLPGSPVTAIVSVTYADVADVTDEVLTDGVVINDTRDLINSNASSLTITDSAGTPLSLTLGIDYTVAIVTGRITRITFLSALGTQPYLASYSYPVDTVLDLETVVLDNSVEPARLYILNGETWPSASSVPNAVRILYDAGYYLDGFSPMDFPLPWRLRGAMELVLAHLYRNREATTDLSLVDLPLGIANMVRKLRLDLGMA